MMVFLQNGNFNRWLIGELIKILSFESFAKNMSKIKKLSAEHSAGMVFFKIFDTINKQLTRKAEKRTLLKRKIIFGNFDRECLNQDIDRFLSSGLLRPLNQVKSDILMLPEEFSKKTVEEADRILKYEFTIYGRLKLPLSANQFSWETDPLTGFLWHNKLGPSYYISANSNGTDIKTIWEIARFQFLCQLSHAYILTRKKQYAQFAMDMVNSWLCENAFPYGPHWARAMEVSIRLTNWSIYLPLLDIQKNSDLEFLGTLSESLLEHLIFIRENIENSIPHGNNHYLANLVALLLGRRIFPSLQWAVDCAKFAEKELEKEVQSQFKNSGINFEGSLPYHRLSSEICLIGAAFIINSGGQLPSGIAERLSKAAMFTQYYTDASRECPIIGDNDSGIFVKFFAGQESNRHQYVRYLFDCILENTTTPQNWDEFLCGIHFMKTPPPVTLIQNNQKEINKDVEYEIQVKEFEGLVVARYQNDAFFFNTLNSSESHSHNDKLSIYPIIEGEELFLDRGSFSYKGFIQKRHKDRMTTSHNGPVLNDWEQNRIWKNDVFYISSDAKPDCIIETSPHKTKIVGWHDGYARYRSGLRVFRKVEWNTSKRSMLITDWAEKKKTNETFIFSWYFLINPAFAAELKNSFLILTRGNHTIHFEDLNGIGFSLREGSYCPTYQTESQCKALIASCNAKIDEKIEFLLHY